MFSIFDDTLKRIPETRLTTTPGEELAAAAWRHHSSGAVVAAIWQNGAAPRESNDTTPTAISLEGVKFTDPVLADLLTGNVFAIPREHWSSDGAVVEFKHLPIYDSPVLVAERAALRIEKP